MQCVGAESRAEVWVTVPMCEVKAAASGSGLEAGCVFLAWFRALHGVTARKTMLCEWFLCPCSALAWQPQSMYFPSNRRAKAMLVALMDLLLIKWEGVLWKRWSHSVSVAQVSAFQLGLGCFYGNLWAKNPDSPGIPPKKRRLKFGTPLLACI